MTTGKTSTTPPDFDRVVLDVLRKGGCAVALSPVSSRRGGACSAWAGRFDSTTENRKFKH